MSEIKIKDKSVEYTYVYRDVKYLRYELDQNKLHLIIPLSCKANVEKYILEKEDWIYRKLVEYEYPLSRLYDDDYDAGLYSINDKTLKFAVEYRKVKYIHYKLYEDRLLLVLPNSYKKTVNEAIRMKEKWLYKQLIKNEAYSLRLDEECKDISLVNRTETQLRRLCGIFIDKYSKQLNVRVNRVQYRDMTTKWGSCSIRSNITLSKLLAYLPDNLVAYIVYHELAHLIVLDHNDAFFDIIKKEFPNYPEYDKKLEQYNYLINKL
jgi:predicted metal-dependent hydrolase